MRGKLVYELGIEVFSITKNDNNNKNRHCFFSFPMDYLDFSFFIVKKKKRNDFYILVMKRNKQERAVSVNFLKEEDHGYYCCKRHMEH